MRALSRNVPVLATFGVCLAMYIVAGLRYDGFFSLRVFLNFFGDNAFLGIVAIGMTFVILSGGIDLSVGALMGCSSIAIAVLTDRTGWHPLAAFSLVLAAGLSLGVIHGLLIQRFSLPPFLVTLAGLFFCRGIGLWISKESVQMDHPLFNALSDIRLPIGDRSWLSFPAILFLLVALVASLTARCTPFGRTIYAIGGSESSAQLMGLPVARTKIAIYALSGLLAALGGVVLSIYTSAGNATAGAGMELDAIAAVVIGGTLLTGGYGSILGTVLGLLIFAIIQSAIIFDGNLSTWWSKIVTGGLLLVFILLQRVINRGIA